MKEKGIGTIAIVSVIVIIVVAVGGGFYAMQDSDGDNSGNGSNGGEKRTINVTGSTTVLPIAQAAAEAWMNENPNDTISVSGGGSGHGIQALIDEEADIGNASRPIKDEEKQTAQDAGVTFVDHEIALDAVSIVVHPSNSVNNLSMEDAKKIFAGEITNWNELDGPDKEIVVYHRAEGSGTRETFVDHLMGDGQVTLEAITKGSNGSMRQAVSDNPNGIGYVGFGYVNDSIKAVSLGGVEPSAETAASGDYPISRYLHMYTDGEPDGLTKDFLDFIFSEEGQQIVEEQDFIKLT